VQHVDELVADQIRFFDQEGLQGVIGVGHSLGAVTTMMASLIRPDLFRALVLIEPVFLLPAVLDLLAAGQASDQTYEIPLVKIARKRRDWWSNREDAFHHFRSKRVFGRFSDEALADYMRFGLVDGEAGGVTLFYSPEWEAHIYSLPPAGVWDLIPLVSQPLLAMRGQETNTLVEGAWTLWQVLSPGASFEEYEASGHLLPMERPDVVAAEIRAFVAALSS